MSFFQIRLIELVFIGVQSIADLKVCSDSRAFHFFNFMYLYAKTYSFSPVLSLSCPQTGEKIIFIFSVAQTIINVEFGFDTVGLLATRCF